MNITSLHNVGPDTVRPPTAGAASADDPAGSNGFVGAFDCACVCAVGYSFLAPTQARPRQRCFWAESDPLLRTYHDREWGVPEYDGRALWEKLALDGFQAGLSWITILRKREAFRVAFRRFDPEKVARFGTRDVARLLANPQIVRSRAKIDATISGARAFLAMQESGVDFSEFVWNFVGGTPIQTTGRIAPQTPLSERLSAALKERGFRFVGPVIVYAWMEAVGLVNDHAVDCYRRSGVRRLERPRR